MDTLIRRNQIKKAEAIFAAAENIKAYTLDNCFTGRPCSPIAADGEPWMLREWQAWSYARLYNMADGSYQLKMTPNYWWNFTSE